MRACHSPAACSAERPRPHGFLVRAGGDGAIGVMPEALDEAKEMGFVRIVCVPERHHSIQMVLNYLI